jgi:hypothetical protein
MKRFSAVAVAFALMFAVAGCQKAEEAKPEVKPVPKAVEKPAEKPSAKAAEQSGNQVEKETRESCIKRNPDNVAYCNCYANEVGKRYTEKAKSGEVTVQDRGQMAVQSALVCKKLNNQVKK